MPTYTIEIEADGISDSALAYRLRSGTPALLARLRGGKVIVDVRTVFPEQETAVVHCFQQALANEANPSSEVDDAGWSET